MEVKNFPIVTQIGIFNNEQEIASWLTYRNNSEYYAQDYIAFINHSPFIYTDFTEECLARYNLQKNYNVKSYGETFEEIPAWWVDILNLIDSEIIRATQERQRQK